MSGRSAFWPLFFGKLEGYRFFTVVRNPYTRLLSAFLQKRSSYERLSKQYWGAVPGFMEKNVVMGFEMFLSHLAHAGVHGDRHWTPQCELLAFPAQFYDSVVKLEHLDEGLNSLLVESRPVLGRGDFALPHPSTAVTNQRSSEHLDQFYTQKSLRLVRKLYARDFDEFNYASDL